MASNVTSDGEVSTVKWTIGNKATLAACLVAFGLSGYSCVTTPIPDSAKTLLCQNFEPLWWSDKDTEETVKEIIIFNAKWSELCKSFTRERAK